MPTKKKTTKKYDLSRSAIVERVTDIIDSLSEIDTFATSPASVADQIGDAVTSLEQLQEEVTEEQY